MEIWTGPDLSKREVLLQVLFGNFDRSGPGKMRNFAQKYFFGNFDRSGPSNMRNFAASTFLEISTGPDLSK